MGASSDLRRDQRRSWPAVRTPQPPQGWQWGYPVRQQNLIGFDVEVPPLSTDLWLAQFFLHKCYMRFSHWGLSLRLPTGTLPLDVTGDYCPPDLLNWTPASKTSLRPWPRPRPANVTRTRRCRLATRYRSAAKFTQLFPVFSAADP